MPEAASGLVIVGSGLAGWALAREVRKLDGRTHFFLATRDSGDHYVKLLTSPSWRRLPLPALPLLGIWRATPKA